MRRLRSAGAPDERPPIPHRQVVSPLHPPTPADQNLLADDHIGSRKAPSVDESHVELYAHDLRLLLKDQAEIWNQHAAEFRAFAAQQAALDSNGAYLIKTELEGRATGYEACAAQLFALVERLTP